MKTQKTRSSSGYAAGRDVNVEMGQVHGAGAVHGGTNVFGGGVTVVVSQSPVGVAQSSAEPTLFEMVDAICGLEKKEQKSFLKFAKSAFERLSLDDVDGRSMKRLHAYVVAIYKGRE